jgi:hypothetical protein
MIDFGVSRLEYLPIEIFMEIFQYLTTHELCLSFSHLNIRLNFILKSVPNLLLTTKLHWDTVLSCFNSFSKVQLHFYLSSSSFLSHSLFRYPVIYYFSTDEIIWLYWTNWTIRKFSSSRSMSTASATTITILFRKTRLLDLYRYISSFKNMSSIW